MSHNSDLSRHYHTLQHITLHYATQLHLITELHTRFLNILIPFTMKMVGPLETHERLLNYKKTGPYHKVTKIDGDDVTTDNGLWTTRRFWEFFDKVRVIQAVCSV